VEKNSILISLGCIGASWWGEY